MMKLDIEIVIELEIRIEMMTFTDLEVCMKSEIKQTSGSLSSQIRRSRYESILALIKFCEENQDADKSLKKLAFKRALSRAHNYNKSLNKKFFSLHFINL